VDITPILCRELVVATRKPRLWGNRSFFAAILLVAVLATLGARYYWDGADLAHHLMAHAARQIFLWFLVAHACAVFGVFSARAVLSIAQEKDRRTLDFLLATRLSNAEIVLSKLAGCMTYLFAEFAVGLPIMLLLYLLGGIDPRLILLAYAGMITTGFFMFALALWVSTGAVDARVAAARSVLFTMGWLIGPFFVSMVFPRIGIRLPRIALTLNNWIMTSSPIGLMMRIGGGASASSGLVDAVAWMSALQVAGGAFLVLLAIARLRSAYRHNVSGESKGFLRRLVRPGWRWRKKPPVGDDPILWREMNTSRASLLGTAVGGLIGLGILGTIGYVTYFLARPALIEVWRHGYGAGITTVESPDWNIMIRFFMSGYGVNPPADIARTDFNSYLRFATTPLIFLLTLIAAGMSSEAIISERNRETWDSLLATPLDARDILRSKMLATLWRMRAILTILFTMWMVGVCAGAIHPFGFIVATVVTAAWTWLFLVFGLHVALAAKDMAASTSRTMAIIFLTTGSLIVPFLMPGHWNSVGMGAGSPPFVVWLSLVSYRDVRAAGRYAVYPHLQWIHMTTGEGPLAVVATCLISIIVPVACGLYIWRNAVLHFDRVVGRPYQTPNAATDGIALAPVPAT
jgi:ABC-type transport system involved in multi-copper enzyme maturation permease subunit